jgi:hypothetical protein
MRQVASEAKDQRKEQTETKEQEQNIVNTTDERKLRDPKDLTKRPSSKSSKATPDHVRVQEHGFRTTAQPGRRVEHEGAMVSETELEALKLAQQEDYKANEGRSTGAGPNPYNLESSRDRAGQKVLEELIDARDENELHNSLMTEQMLAAHAASSGESTAADAEVQTIGDTRTDTGQKIVEKPDRVDAQDRAVLPHIGLKHSKLVDSERERALEEGRFEPDYRSAVAHGEAAEESDEDLRADANAGAMYGGSVHER